MKLKWNVFGKNKPKVSGFYFIKKYNEVELAYYDVTLDSFLYFEYGYEYLYRLPGFNIESLQWAKLANIPKSKLLNLGYLELDFNG